MPLSEHEERILAEIERRLHEEDPRFIRRTRRATSRNGDALGVRLSFAIAGFAIGLVCLFFLTFHLAFGVVGFALMFVSVIAGVTALRDDEEEGALADRVRRVFGSSRTER